MTRHESPVLDTGGEDWIGSFPGLGRVVVHPDGGYEIELDPRHAGDEAAHDALEFGWAELLSFARQGFRLATATTMVPFAAHDEGGGPAGALMLSGGAQATAEVALGLAGRGWSLVADTVTPLLTAPALVAHPRRGPWIAPRGLAVESSLVDGVRLRPGATAQSVRGRRYDRPVPVTARLAVVDKPSRDREVLEQVRGRDRLGAQFQVLGTVQAGARIPARQLMQEDLALASLPTAQLFWAAPKGDTDLAASVLPALLEWWTDVTA